MSPFHLVYQLNFKSELIIRLGYFGRRLDIIITATQTYMYIKSYNPHSIKFQIVFHVIHIYAGLLPQFSGAVQ